MFSIIRVFDLTCLWDRQFKGYTTAIAWLRAPKYPNCPDFMGEMFVGTKHATFRSSTV